MIRARIFLVATIVHVQNVMKLCEGIWCKWFNILWALDTLSYAVEFHPLYLIKLYLYCSSCEDTKSSLQFNLWLKASKKLGIKTAAMQSNFLVQNTKL